MLEPDVGKLASPVLRGRGGGNIALLPGPLRHTGLFGGGGTDPLWRFT